MHFFKKEMNRPFHCKKSSENICKRKLNYDRYIFFFILYAKHTKMVSYKLSVVHIVFQFKWENPRFDSLNYETVH